MTVPIDDAPSKRTGQKLLDGVRGLLTDEEVDTLFSRTHVQLTNPARLPHTPDPSHSTPVPHPPAADI